jgi:hypothetical protein
MKRVRFLDMPEPDDVCNDSLVKPRPLRRVFGVFKHLTCLANQNKTLFVCGN